MTPRKTLYLDGRTPLRVQRAGPALEVHSEGCSAVWYPLPRLSAIVCRGPVGWMGDALQACIEHGLVVMFLDFDERCIGVASGVPAEQFDLGRRLELAAVRPGWEQRYQTWLRAQHHRRARYACQALQWAEERDLRLVRQRLQTALHERLGADADATLARLASLLRVDIAAELAQAGLTPDQLAGLATAGHLPNDLLSLLQWPLRGRLLTVRRLHALRDLRSAADTYHSYLRAPLIATCRRIIASLWSIGL